VLHVTSAGTGEVVENRYSVVDDDDDDDGMK